MCGTIGKSDKTIGKTSPSTNPGPSGEQNNIPKYVFAGSLPENTQAAYNNLLNALDITVLETESPVYFHFQKKAPTGSLLIFETWTWKFGKGVYPSVGAVSPIESMYLLETNYPQLTDLTPVFDAGTLINLDEIFTDLITYINNQVEFDLSDEDTTYYIQFILDEVTQVYQYTGTPEIYGTSTANTALITDFDLIYSSINSGTFSTPQNLQQTVDIGHIADKITLRNKTTFDTTAGFDGTVNGILKLPDGRFFVYGSFSTYKTVPVISPGLILFDENFNVDTSFAPVTLPGTSIATMSIVDENTVLIGGSFSAINGVSRNRLALLNLVDGSNDGTFVLGSGFNNPVISSVVIEDKIYLLGGFTTYKGGAVSRILSLNLNGSINATFNVGSGLTGIVSNGKLLYDGTHLYVGSNFTAYNGTAANNIISLNLNGSINTGFVYGSGFNNVVQNLLIKDNKLYIAGGFTNYNGNGANSIISLNLDGTINATFNTGTGFTGVANKIFDNGENLLIGGNVLNYNGTAIGRIVSVNLDGTINPVFNAGIGFNASVTAIDKINDTFIIGGGFVTFKGVTANRFILLNETADYTNEIIEDKLTFNKNGNGIGEYFTNKTFDQLGENEMISKKLIKSILPKEAIYYIEGQDDTGFTGLVEKKNNTGVNFTFDRDSPGVFIFGGFDKTKHILTHSITLEARNLLSRLDYSADDELYTQRANSSTDGIFINSDDTFTSGGWIIIRQID